MPDDESMIQVQSEPNYSKPDEFLAHLVSEANLNPNGVGLPVTLLVGGTIVSGQLVSGRLYFNGIADVLAQALLEDTEADEELAQKLGDRYRPWGDKYKDQDELDQAGEDPPRHLTFIHLRNAQVRDTAGNCIGEPKGVWWRGKLAAVDGYFLGTIGTASYHPVN